MTTLALEAAQAPFSRARLAIRELLDQPRHHLALRLTLLLMILHGGTAWALDVPIRILCGIMILSPVLLSSPLLWLSVAGATVWVHSKVWFSIDNHKYLMAYWIFACVLAVTSKAPDKVLSTNARRLIGLCFLFAFAWKLLGGEFLDGSFLHYTLLKDSRIEAMAVGLGGLTQEALAENRALISTLRGVPGEGMTATLNTTDQVRLLGLGLSYWTLFIEGLVALAFLMKPASKLARFRDLYLMTFIATTYFVLPVTGFAFTLALLGYAQCDLDRTKTRATYLGLFIAIQLTRVPWDNIVTSWLSR